jgi:hypothetical protein
VAVAAVEAIAAVAAAAEIVAAAVAAKNKYRVGAE